jgi:AsmA protein
MKRIAWISAAVALAAILLFALVIALLPREVLKTRIGEQIAAWTGREVSLSGEPEIDLFPSLRVTLNDIRVSGPAEMSDAEIVSMDRLTGTIRLLPLIIGRVEIGSFTMVRPLIRLVRDAEGSRNWAFDAGAAALQLAFAGDVPLGDFVVEDGTIVFEDRASPQRERVDSVNLAVDWDSVRQPLKVAGSGIWRGEQVTVTATATEPFAYLNGRATAVDARIDSAPLAMIFDGEASEYPDPRLSGGLKLSTPSLRGFASWLGSPLGPGSTLGPASIFGSAVYKDGLLAVGNAEITLDGNAASGALTITAAARPDIAGTLDFATLDLTPYFAGLAGALRDSADWRNVALATGWLHAFTADIRLSSGSVRLGEIEAGDTAASVSLREARLEIGLARAVLDGGVLAGDFAVVDLNGAPGLVEAQLRAKDVSLAATAAALGLPESTSGAGSAVLDVATSGGTPGDLLRNLGGSGNIELRNGAMPLFGMAELAAGGTAPPDSGFATGVAAPFTSVSAELTFGRGIGVLDRASVSTSAFNAEARGWIGLLDGSLGLTGTVWPGAGGVTTEARQFTIEGTLRRPVARSLALAN